MRPRTTPPPVQLALDLKRETTALPIAREPAALLQAIADLAREGSRKRSSILPVIEL